jgi:hypothetical protein
LVPIKTGNSFFIGAFLAVLSISFLLLAGSTVGHTTVQYDEFTDLVIALSLSQNPLRGHDYDGSQARFPMYVTAAAFRFLQLANPDLALLDLLPYSRWISILMTVLAIWGTYLIGARLFDQATGMLAAALFTLSPYVLHFGQDALTQGDAFTPATVVFTLIAFERFTSRRNTFWLVCFSFFLALSIAAKFYLAVLIPVLLIYQLILHFTERHHNSLPASDPTSSEGAMKVDRVFTILAISAGLLTLLALIAALSRAGHTGSVSNLLNQLARLLWVCALLAIVFCLAMAVRDSGVWRFRSRGPAVNWSRGWAWLAVLPLSFAMMMALFPTHIFSPSVIPTLFDRFLTLDGNSDLLATAVDSARLYLGLILFKLGLPFGILTCLALAWAVKKAFVDRAFLLVVLTLFFFGLMLAVLPLQQPFWLMSVYPLILLVLSAMIIHILASLKDKRLRYAWTTVVVVAFAWLIIGLIHVYPTYGYYGYEMIGDRWLGENAIGYREVIVVTNDGSTEAIDWLRQNAPAGSLVVSYLNDLHLINYLNSIELFGFELTQAVQYEDSRLLDEDLARADYVVVRVVDDLSLPLPTADPDFTRQYGSEPVFEVVRGRGAYRMPLIQIFQRLADPDDAALQQ